MQACDSLSGPQGARFLRGGDEEIGLQDVKETAMKWMFMIRASSGRHYIIRVKKRIFKVQCNCPDAENHPWIACKHTCWLVFGLYGLTDVSILRNITLPESIVRNSDRVTLLATRFRCPLTDTESDIETDSDGEDLFNSLMLHDTGVINSYNDTDRELQAILRKRTAFLDGFGGHAPEADAECSVCYEDLQAEYECNCVHCPGCHNHFHTCAF